MSKETDEPLPGLKQLQSSGLANSNNPRSPFPRCVSLTAWHYEPLSGNGAPLHVDLRFGTETLSAKKGDDEFCFSISIREATLEFIHIEEAAIKKAGVHGIKVQQSIAQTSKFRRVVKKAVEAKINGKFDATSLTSLSDCLTALASFNFDTVQMQEIATEAGLEEVLSPIEMIRDRNGNPSWAVKTLQYPGADPNLDGRYWDPDNQPLCTARSAGSNSRIGPAVLLGVVAFPKDISIQVDENKLAQIFEKSFSALSFKTKLDAAKIYLQEILKDYFQKDVNFDRPGEKILLATAMLELEYD